MTTAPAVDPFTFFQPTVAITANHRRQMDHEHSVARVIATKDPEVGVWAAVPVIIDGERLVAWMHRIEELKKSPYVLAIGRVSDPPRLDDLAGLSLDDDEMSDLGDCRPGRCDVKLTGGGDDRPARRGGTQPVARADRRTR